MFQVNKSASRFSPSHEYHNLIGPLSWAYQKKQKSMAYHMMHRKCMDHHYQNVNIIHRQAVEQTVQYLIKIVKVIWMILHQNVNNADIEQHSPVFNWRNWKKHSHEHIIQMYLQGIFPICFFVFEKNTEIFYFCLCNYSTKSWCLCIIVKFRSDN